MSSSLKTFIDNIMELKSTPFSLGRFVIHINWWLALCVFMSVTLFINLGFWQLSRAVEKRQMQREAETQMLAEPVPIEKLLAQAGSDDDWALHNRRVLLQGEYLNDAAFLIVFQFFQGQPGFELVSPFRLSSDNSLVLVSRGWIAPGPAADSLPVIQVIPGEQTLQGQIHVPAEPTVAGQIEERAWPVRLRFMHIPQAEGLLGESVFPHVVRLNAGSAGLLARHWPTVTISTRNNIGYALQWFGFALATLVISLLMSSNLLQLLRERHH